jgi:hypothetical protein
MHSCLLYIQERLAQALNGLEPDLIVNKDIFEAFGAGFRAITGPCAAKCVKI